MPIEPDDADGGGGGVLDEFAEGCVHRDAAAEPGAGGGGVDGVGDEGDGLCLGAAVGREPALVLAGDRGHGAAAEVDVADGALAARAAEPAALPAEADALVQELV